MASSLPSFVCRSMLLLQVYYINEVEHLFAYNWHIDSIKARQTLDERDGSKTHITETLLQNIG